MQVPRAVSPDGVYGRVRYCAARSGLVRWGKVMVCCDCFRSDRGAKPRTQRSSRGENGRQSKKGGGDIRLSEFEYARS
jgi:hypothetical protein